MNKIVVRRLCVPFSMFTPGDFYDIDSLVATLYAQEDLVSHFLWNRFSPQGRQRLEAPTTVLTSAMRH